MDSKLIAERVTRRFRAKVIHIDDAWVDKMRKDFLALLKNVPKVKDYATGIELKDAINRWNRNFDDVFFGEYLRKSLKYDRSLSESDRSYYTRSLSKIGWDLHIELGMFPLQRADDYWTEGARFRQYEKAARLWSNRVKRKAQKFWSEVRYIVKHYEKIRSRRHDDPDKIEVEVPDVDRTVLEGFQVEVRGFRPGYDVDESGLAKLTEALKLYRQRASQVAPIVLKHQLPMVMDFRASLGKGGEFRGKTIMINGNAIVGDSNIREMVRILAHEMGHYIFSGVLAGDARDQWSRLIRGDYKSLDLGELLAKWPNDMWAYEYVKHLSNTDPVLALQLDTIWQGYSPGYDTEMANKEDFQRLLDQGTRKLNVPANPISGYGGKNPEEAFCEALGNLVAYGPRAVLPQIVQWLRFILPGQIKIAEWVAFRHRAARAIRLDKRRIKELAKELESVLARKSWPGESLGNRMIVPAAPYTIRAVDGTPLSMYVRLNAIETKSPYYVVDGGYGFHRGYQTPIVVVNVNGSMPADQLRQAAKDRQVQNQLYPVLLHELTHAADKYHKGIGSRMTEDEIKGDRKTYYNDPGEVRAYMQEVVDEAEAHFQHWPKLSGTFGPSKAMSMMLNMSPTWTEVSPHWSERNKRLVTKAVVQALNDWENEQ